MNAYEIMLSESQERMVLVATPDRVAEISEVLNHWSLNASVIGQVTDTGRVVVRDGNEVVCDVPVRNFIDDCPVYPIDPERPAYLDEVQVLELDAIPDIDGAEIANTLERMLQSPNLGSRRSIWEQYDHTILTNTVVGPGQGDAAVIRQKGTNGGMAISMDCNSRYVYLDPYVGAQHAVAEAARNVACAGARPLGLTNCLNFGSPERNPADYQLVHAVKGMGEASRQLDVPIVSGNVSLYNETSRQPVYPTPMIGCVGVLEDIQAHMRMAWTEGQSLWLVGSGKPSLGGSEYLAHLCDTVAGAPPELDLEHEVRLIRFLRELASSRFGAAVHDLSSGGLALAIADMALASCVGVTINDIPHHGRNDVSWFGESAGRVLVAVDAAASLQLRRLAEEWELACVEIGSVGGDGVVLQDGSEITLKALELASDSALTVGVEAEMA